MDVLDGALDGALVVACAAGDVAAVARLLDAGADANARAGEPILVATRRGDRDVVELLLDAGADARAQESLALLHACDNCDVGMLERLRQAGADLRGARMDQALSRAVQDGDERMLRHLFADSTAGAGADLDGAMAKAAEDGRTYMCDLLQCKGARVHAPPAAGAVNRRDALEAVAGLGDVGLVEWFLGQGATAPAPVRQASLDNALVMASWAGHAEVVQVLLAAGANVHASNERALLKASVEAQVVAHAPVLPLLLAAGADVHADDDRALRTASAYGKVRTVAALLAAGADVHAKDDEALTSAACYGHDDVVAQLLAAGADVCSGKYRALKQVVQSEYGDQLVLAQLVAAGAATWPLAADGAASAAQAPRFLAFIHEVIALEQRLEAATEHGDVAEVDAVLATPSPLGPYVDVDEAICHACRHGHAAVVARLIAVGADVRYGAYDAANGGGGGGAGYFGQLAEACVAGHVAVVALLVAAGADVNLLDGAPLILAAEAGHTALIDWLLGHGAALQDTALNIAAKHGHALALARLLAAGPANRAMQSAVRAAVTVGEDTDRVAIVRQLVEAGADLNTMDDDTLALAAGMDRSLPLVELLLQARANVHTQDDGALAAACRRRSLATVERLADAGASLVRRVDWTCFRRDARARLVLRVRAGEATALPRWMRLVRSLHLARVRRGLRRALARARDRLNRPPPARHSKR